MVDELDACFPIDLEKIKNSLLRLKRIPYPKQQEGKSNNEKKPRSPVRERERERERARKKNEKTAEREKKSLYAVWSLFNDNYIVKRQCKPIFKLNNR